jgi:dolichol-phosphate mannosyltransferase
MALDRMQVERATESDEYRETGVVDVLQRDMASPKYSVVAPVYNDGALALAFCEAIAKTFRSYLDVEDLLGRIELIFVNDGSRNDSLKYLKDMARRYPFVRVIDLSRNFGQHIAIACGLAHARGSVVLRMNIDLQDHPDQIPLLLDAMHKEHLDLVVGQYAVRESPWANRLTAWLYFHLFEFLTGFTSPQNTSPLRAMSRRFVDAYNCLTERSRFPQGLDQWLGFDHKYVPIEHSPRSDGKSSYNFWSRLRLGIEGILYFSNRPLTLIAIAGFVLSLIGLALGLYVIMARVFWVALLPGYASIVSVGLVAFGIQLGCMGVVGLYVARIFAETQNRPLYIIKACYTHADEDQDRE